ncbi:LamG domain-containing protein [Paenibacillus piri]|uniref:LamG domain-containing protein n=2 Tax=Paenibacillus piri TaxID=2547395 RepID=A0A4R5KT07_9BACL|nr:LamG domain-containing protein [Paenibacillus piri]
MNLPGLVSFWDFQEEAGQARIAKGPVACRLEEMAGPVARTEDGLFGRYAASLQYGQWLRAPRSACPELNFCGKRAAFSILAWLKREDRFYPQCQAVAGMWNETEKKRQYCLFLDLRIWDSADQIGGHVSSGGGATPGYPWCMTTAIGATPVTKGEWHCAAFTYDGTYAKVYLDGTLDRREGYNPYLYDEGLHDGGMDGADFTVGAVHRSGEIGNFYAGLIGGLAIFNRTLTEMEIENISNC